MKRIALFIATQKGLECLNRALEYSGVEVGLVCTFTEVNMAKRYDIEIQKICDIHGVESYYNKEISSDIVSFMKGRDISYAFAIGWRFLIPLTINETLETGLVVFHDSLLPKYRGFAPTPTAMMCEEKTLGITALYATERMDGGDILLQRTFTTEPDEFIESVINKQSQLYGEMLIELLTRFLAGDYSSSPQDESLASYSIWRDDGDLEINWSLDAVRIYNQIRAVSYPYPGAYTFYSDRKIIIKNAQPCGDIEFAIRDSGKIFTIEDGYPVVVCGSGMLKILEAVYDDGETVAFSRLRVRLGRNYRQTPK